MITYQRLPGTLNKEALNGISDWFGMPTWVKSYWKVVKQNIQNIKDVGYKISLHQQKLGVAYSSLMAKGRKDLADQLKDEIAKAADDLKKYWKVKGYIDTYLPQWMKLDENVEASGVSFVPVVLAGMSLTALSYVVTTGMALVQDYAYKSQLTSAVIEQKMTSGQAAEILSVPKSEGVLEKVITKAGMGIGIGLPLALLVGGGIYLAVTTGMLRGLLGGGKQ